MMREQSCEATLCCGTVEPSPEYVAAEAVTTSNKAHRSNYCDPAARAAKLSGTPETIAVQAAKQTLMDNT